MSTPNYHGPLPVTSTDKKMAKQHLDATANLLKLKITDHVQAKKATTDPKSKAYNQSHIDSHQQDLQKVNRSKTTLSQIKGGSMAQFNTKKTGSYKGQSNAPGGGGRFKQMTDSGMSKGLAAYIGRKKFGAAKMASMAAKGK